MAQNVFSPDAWTSARNRFVEDLTDEEQGVYFQASPETILYDASAAERIHKAKSTTREFVMKLQPLVEAVEQYGEALDVYSNIYPLVMGPLWGSVRIVLHLVRESGKYFEKIVDMFNRISDLLPRLRIYEHLFPNHKSLVQALSLVYFDVLKFCSDAKVMLRRTKHAILTLVWKPFERQFGSHMDAFRRHQKEMEKEVSLSHMIEAADSRALIRSDQMKLAKERYDEERLSIFASLSPVDYEAKHRKLRGLRHEGTGTWVIQHPTYVAWKESTASEGLFCHGIPGSGKSVLTSLIVDEHLERLDSPAKKALYFYCDYADPLTLQPVYIYRAILQQLFFRGLMTEAIVKTAVETLKSNAHGLGEQKLTNLIRDAIQSCAGLHIIIDGLDECERNAQQAVTNTLCQLLKIGHPVVKTLITCRDEGHLLTEAGTFGRLHISSHASAADIQSYISHAIASSLSSGRLTIRDRALKEEIVTKLVEKAQGMFLWVHFQITDLCDAASDEDIRHIIGHLPEGLFDTYTRIFMKIAKTGSKATVLKIMKWMVCARRLLRLEELQEAVAFGSDDKSWNVDKIPDGDKIIRCCHGLVVRDADDGKVRLAHHTVRQYLVYPHESALTTDLEEVTLGANFWPGLKRFRFDHESAEMLAGMLCANYLCFSDFGTAVSRVNDERNSNLTTAFKDRGPISIPAALGLGKSFHSLPYKFFGNHKNFKMPEIDYSKYLNIKPRDRRPSPDFKSKFALLEYVIEYWPWHTRWLPRSSESESSLRFWDLVQHKSLAFEFRPWGPNQHFGPNGCKGCPVPDSDDLESKDLPSMGLVHWAAETGHLGVFDMVEPPLQEYLRHERHHDETILIACRHGQDAVVEYLLGHRTFDFSDGRAIVATCASGNASILEQLLHAQEAISALSHRPGPLSTLNLRNIGPVALYQAASNGHMKIVEILLASGTQTNASDTATGLTPLQAAAKNAHLQVFRLLYTAVPLQKEPGSSDIYTLHKDSGIKALHYAAANGHDKIVAFLVQHGMGCDDRDSLDETPLIKASQNGQAIVAKLLLEGGADPRLSGGEHYHSAHQTMSRSTYTPWNWLNLRPVALHHAASNGHDNVLAILPYSDVTCGAYRTNALHLGAGYGHPNVVAALLLKGAKMESKDSMGMTALHYASRNGHILVVQLLLDKGCKIDQEADGGYTALHRAVETAKVEVIKHLVAHGAAISAKTSERKDTALHLATRHADANTVRVLVECGAPLEEQNWGGRTALDEAIRWKSLENVRALIELGAEWIRDQTFNYAIQMKTEDTVEIFLSKLSTATAKERGIAAAVIKRKLKIDGRDKNEKAVRMLETWRRNEESAPHT